MLDHELLTDEDLEAERLRTGRECRMRARDLEDWTRERQALDREWGRRMAVKFHAGQLAGGSGVEARHAA